MGYRVEIECRAGECDLEDESFTDALLDALVSDTAVTGAVLQLHHDRDSLAAVVFADGPQFIAAQNTAWDAFQRAWEAAGRDPAQLSVERTHVEEVDAVGETPQEKLNPATRGHKAVAIFAHMTDEERMVYLAVLTLNSYERNATCNHIKKFLADKLATISKLLGDDDRLEEVLDQLRQQGFLDTFVDNTPFTEMPVNTDVARFSSDEDVPA